MNREALSEHIDYCREAAQDLEHPEAAAYWQLFADEAQSYADTLDAQGGAS